MKALKLLTAYFLGLFIVPFALFRLPMDEGEIFTLWKSKPNNHTRGFYTTTATTTEGDTGTFYYGVFKYPFIDRK